MLKIADCIWWFFKNEDFEAQKYVETQADHTFKAVTIKISSWSERRGLNFIVSTCTDF